MLKSQHVYESLSRRERQIVSIVHRLGEATAREVLEALDDAPSYSAVRSALSLLTAKGVLRYEHAGKQYVYRPVARERDVQKGALDHLVETFFGGSPARAVTALLSRRDLQASEEELERLERLVRAARQRRKERR